MSENNKTTPKKIVDKSYRKPSDSEVYRKHRDAGAGTFVSGRPPKRPTGNNPK